ncbi:ATP-binding protein [Methanomicrobium mobile]|uniref:ATP-binding protein n=1 Tax=Methanomicrobium mobile TaxID=2205 RepID=UPI0005B2E974|nr:ATP-binding protein [Methanomicrobium mobile]
MYRELIGELAAWKDRADRKPLIIRGARQVGKTWLMKEFGDKYYAKTYYINFENSETLKGIFERDINPSTVIPNLELYLGEKIDAEASLLIFDEIQEVPRALTSLKYFCEDAPEYNIICAGSLLGVALHQGTSFPVGKVEFLSLYPLSFTEFLMATGKEQFAGLIKDGNFDTVSRFRDIYIAALKSYYYIGGMPEVVADFAKNADYERAREIQTRIIDAYGQDLSKHAPSQIIPRIRMIWDSIPAQLSKENKKYIYGLIKEGARAKDFELALLWLCDCGLTYRINRVTAPRIPLKAYEDFKAFKLFVLDVGLLSCMVSLDSATLLNGNTLFSEFKGALTEQFVAQQIMRMKGLDLFYWTNDKGSAEIDFLTSVAVDPIPIEVKAEENLRAKSLKTFREKFEPKTSVRVSMSDFRIDGDLINLPLYAIEALPKAVAKK